jgi:hypothetical protein
MAVEATRRHFVIENRPGAGTNRRTVFPQWGQLFATAGNIRVSDSELHITLAPLSSPHRTLAAQALCETLDQTATMVTRVRSRLCRLLLVYGSRAMVDKIEPKNQIAPPVTPTPFAARRYWDTAAHS